MSRTKYIKITDKSPRLHRAEYTIITDNGEMVVDGYVFQFDGCPKVKFEVHINPGGLWGVGELSTGYTILKVFQGTRRDAIEAAIAVLEKYTLKGVYTNISKQLKKSGRMNNEADYD